MVVKTIFCLTLNHQCPEPLSKSADYSSYPGREGIVRTAEGEEISLTDADIRTEDVKMFQNKLWVLLNKR